MNRAADIGLVGHMITGGTLSDSRDALNIANEREDCFSTCGVHPTRCNEFESADDSEAYLEGLKKLIMENENKILAVGECGIDYERVEQTNPLMQNGLVLVLLSFFGSSFCTNRRGGIIIFVKWVKIYKWPLKGV